MVLGTTILYFTGTGNCLKVAKDLAAGLDNANLIQISQKNLGEPYPVDSGTVGIVFPVYYAGLPHMVKRCAEEIHVEPGTYVFAVATYGSMPGISS